MPLSNSVLHRYTPPTCTLQVVAYSSPVSRWVGTKVVKEVQFDLRFDDPRSPVDQQFNIAGDRHQLESLHTVVTNYIHKLLNLSPESFAALGQEAPPAPPVDVESDVWLTPTDDHPPATTPQSTQLMAQSESFTIKPVTKVTHNLFLGSLATVETGQFIQLSILQIFDLATALDEYASDLIALPTSSKNAPTASAPLAWVNIAAVLLLGVGVTAVGLQVFNRPNSLQTANNLNNRPKTTNSPNANTIARSPFPTLSPATTILVPSPNSSIPAQGSTRAVAPPSKAQVSQLTPGSKVNPSPNGLPPQPIVINPSAGQTTTTTVTVPGASNPVVPSSVAVIPSPNLQATPSSTTVAKQDTNSPSQEDAPTAPPPPKNVTRTAFVANPQVVEVSSYFNQRWEPPSSLRSSLEYSIILDVDGTIQAIEPYGLAARTYLDRTGMPLIGERFVSANQNGQSPRIRLRFNPDGTVQAFMETGNAR